MNFRVVPITGNFLVVDAASANVGRMLILLRAHRVPWIVVRNGDKFFVFPLTDVVGALKMPSSTPLAAALGVDRIQASISIKSNKGFLDLELSPPPDTPASRVVVLKRNSNNLVVVSAVGTVKQYAGPTVKVTAVGKRRVGSTELRKGGRSIKYPSKKAVNRIAARKKAAPIFAVGDSTPRKKSGTMRVRKTHFFKVIDVFFATDREPKPSNSSTKIAQYLNRLPEKRKLEYGICNVTIPAGHKLGTVESPSIWSFEVREDPEKHFTIRGCAKRSMSAFFTELQGHVDHSSERSCFVFIHGYNVSFEDAAKQTAQLACDLKFLGVPILYSWASAASLAKYSKDVETVEMTVDSLATFMSRLARFSGARKIHLIAHSMGNRALVKALKQLTIPGNSRPFNQVVLTAPDVPTQNVEPLITAASERAERVTLYASNKDKALGLSKMKNDYQRLGKVYGFPFVHPGMDSIDASKVRTDFWAHSVFSKARTVLGDLAALMTDGHPPDQRFGLERVISPHGVCWAIIP